MAGVLLFMLLLGFNLPGQAATPFARDWNPEFIVRVTDYFPDDSAPVQTVFSCIFSHADLQFLRNGGMETPKIDGSTGNTASAEMAYQAHYEISLEIFQQDRKGRSGKNAHSDYGRWDVGAKTYKETGARGSLLWQSFECKLEPGKYNWWIEFQDLNTRRNHRVEGKFEVHGNQSEWQLGRLWQTVDAPDSVSNPLLLTPVAPGGLDDGSGVFSIFYQVRSKSNVELELSSRILNKRGKLRHENSVFRDYGAGVSQNQFLIPLEKLGAGRYTLELSLGTGADKQVQKTAFDVRWLRNPVTGEDLETAIAQLRYIAGHKKMKELRNSRAPHNRMLFDHFWARYDPDPKTEINELKHEYYERVAIANSSFAWARFPGWKSDRGRTYILFGEPSVRELYEEDFDSPAMERWVYADTDQEYFFVDEHGFGEFRSVPEVELRR